MILPNADDLAMIINYDRNHSFIVLTTVITIVNNGRKTFIVQATNQCHQQWWHINFAITSVSPYQEKGIIFY